MAGSLLSPTHLALLLVVVLLLFGAKRLPELGKSLGTSMRAFKDSIDLDGESHSPSQLPAPAERPSSVSREIAEQPQVHVAP